MNILYLHCHDAGRFISPYGHPMPTPNLMGLARQSTLFRHAYCAGPTCSASRAAMLTGMSAHESGMIGLAHRGFHISDPGRHLASYLRTRGYQTALAGVQHEFAEHAPRPYDRELAASSDPDPKQTDRADEDREIARQAAAYLRNPPPGRPFFLACGFVMPHRVYPSPDPVYSPNYIQPPSCLPDTHATRTDMAAYMTAVRGMDEGCGTVLDALESSPARGDTLVLFTTDHGIAFPWMKCHLYDHGIGVALMLRYPRNPSAGSATDALVSHLDVFPTLCDLAGLPPPPHLRGRSMRPILQNPAASIRDEIFAEVTYHAAYEPMRCIRTARHKLIRIYDTDLPRIPCNTDRSPSKQVLLDNNWLDHPRSPLQLYDLMLDPAERNNLAGVAPYAAIQRNLESRLDQWMRQTNDPLLAGPVPLPPAACANTQDTLHADDPSNQLITSP